MERELGRDNNSIPFVKETKSLHTVSFLNQNDRREFEQRLKDFQTHYIPYPEGIFVPTGINPELTRDLETSINPHPSYHFQIQPSSDSKDRLYESNVLTNTLDSVERELGIEESVDTLLSADIVVKASEAIIDTFANQIRNKNLQPIYSERGLTQNLLGLFEQIRGSIPEEIVIRTMEEIEGLLAPARGLRSTLLSLVSRISGHKQEAPSLVTRLRNRSEDVHHEIRSMIKACIAEGVRHSALKKHPLETMHLLGTMLSYAQDTATFQEDRLKDVFSVKRVSQTISGYSPEGVFVRLTYSKSGSLYANDLMMERYDVDYDSNLYSPVYWLTNEYSLIGREMGEQMDEMLPRMQITIGGNGFHDDRIIKRVRSSIFDDIYNLENRFSWN